MSIFSLKNIVLPAILVSSAVFSALTLPFILVKSDQPQQVDLPFLPEPVIIEPPPILEDEGPSFLKSDNRDLAIRYIGGSIVISVVAGIATVDVLRRLHASRRLVPPETASLLRQMTASPAAGAESELPIAPETSIEASANDSLFAAAAEEPELFSQFEANSALVLLPPEGQQDEQRFHAASSPIIESERWYERCRIRVPHLEQRLYAILFNGEYYSYFKIQDTKEKALDVVSKLNRRGNRSVITRSDRGYEVWIWQPEAFLDLVS